MLIDRLKDFLDDSSGAETAMSRRGFLTVGLAAGGGLVVGIGLASEDAVAAPAPGRAVFAPNAFVTIDAQGRVTVVNPYVEMGQGTYTSVPMLVAEELEVDLPSVRYAHAPSNDKLFANPLLGFQVTGGSTTIRGSYELFRRAGATAKQLLVQAAAQRWSVPPAECRAERGAVVHAGSGRRLGYGALAADAAKLPVPETVELKSPAHFKLIGTRAKRLDTPAKVDGSALYGIDVRLPGMKVAAIAQAPAFGGRLRGLDDSKARTVRGVRQIVRLDDAVAVVADHLGAAKKGLGALVLDWDDGPNAGVSTADIVRSMEEASRGPAVAVRKEGDHAAAMASGTQRLEAVYQVPFLAHAAMEPVNCTVHVRPDRCEVWTGTQVISRAQAVAATVTGLPPERVIVHNFMLGGGFGRRLEVDMVARAVQVAKHVAGPVKVVWSREEDLQHDMYRPYFYDRMSAALGADGKPVAWGHRITGSSILKRWAPPLFKDGWDFETVDGAVQPPYALPNVLIEYVNHEPPQIPTAFWRGVGPTHNVFVVESFIDELAAAARQDPVAYRLALLEGNPRAKAVLELAAAKAGWGTPMPGGWGRGVSVQFAFGSYTAQVAEVQVQPSGEIAVKKVVCAVDCGVVVNPDTVEAQMVSATLFGATAALWGEVTFKNGRVEQSNFHDYRPLRINEAPEIQVHIVPSTMAPGGMGEPGTSGIAPAIANAVFAATGKRLRKLPLDTGALQQA